MVMVRMGFSGELGSNMGICWVFGRAMVFGFFSYISCIV
jgi:hypothetical protein